jgi:hypothetical protein
VNHHQNRVLLDQLWVLQGGRPLTAIFFVAGDKFLLEKDSDGELNPVFARHLGSRQDFAGIASSKANSYGQTVQVNTMRPVGGFAMADLGRAAVVAVDVVGGGSWVPPGCVWVKMQDVFDHSGVSQVVRFAARKLHEPQDAAVISA